MTYQASGTFDVKLTQQPATSDWGLGRLTIDKQFHGDLTATSSGEMLSAMTAVEEWVELASVQSCAEIYLATAADFCA